MWWPNLPVQSIVDISYIIPVYIIHIRSFNHSKLSGAVPVITQKVRVQKDVFYHLGYVMIISQTRNDFVLHPLLLGIYPNVKDWIQFPRYLEGYRDSEGSIVHVLHA